MIVLDTLNLTQLASVMRNASEQITEAVQLLNQTTVHNDWGCKERVAINENTITNKATAAILQEAAQAFAQAVTNAATTFTETESTIGNWHSVLEDVLHDFFTPSPVYSPSEWMGEIMDVVKDAVNDSPHTGNNHPQPAIFDTADILWDIIPIPNLYYEPYILPDLSELIRSAPITTFDQFTSAIGGE